MGKLSLAPQEEGITMGKITASKLFLKTLGQYHSSEIYVIVIYILGSEYLPVDLFCILLHA